MPPVTAAKHSRVTRRSKVRRDSPLSGAQRPGDRPTIRTPPAAAADPPRRKLSHARTRPLWDGVRWETWETRGVCPGQRNFPGLPRLGEHSGSIRLFRSRKRRSEALFAGFPSEGPWMGESLGKTRFGPPECVARRGSAGPNPVARHPGSGGKTPRFRGKTPGSLGCCCVCWRVRAVVS
jgi:hypothetical protein